MKLISNFIGFVVFSFAAFYLFSISGCFDSDHPMDKLVISKAIENAAPFTIYNTEVQEGKTVKGGLYVQGSVNVPFDISRTKIKPTILAVLKQLREKHPKSEWFVVYLCPGGERACKLGINLGRGEYIDEKITIQYGLLSKEEWIKLEERYKAGEMEFATPDFLKENIFRIGLGISEDYYSYYKENFDAELSYQLVSQKTDSSVQLLKTLRKGLFQYYTYGQEQETIE